MTGVLEITERQQSSKQTTEEGESRALPAPPHVDQLDGLRGVAIVMVMLFHMNAASPVGALAVAWAELCKGGNQGVDVFFVLSGFLITGILLNSLHGSHYFRNFYARRALRILPLYYAVLTFAFLVLPRFAGERAA